MVLCSGFPINPRQV